MGGDPMGGDASSMPMGGPNMMGTDPDGGVVGEQGAPGDPNAMGGDPSMMGGDPNAMGGAPGADPMAGGDPNMMGGDDMSGNEPVMGANPFDNEGDADVSGDPEKKAESLAGQLASIFRNDLANDGINKHEDKKKEILGMVASAIVDGMSEEDRNSMVEYLSDKLNGAGESDGDEDNNNDQNDDMNGDMGSMDDGSQDMMGGDPSMMGDDQSQQMMEQRVNEVVNSILREFTVNDMTKPKKKNEPKSEVEKRGGYNKAPFERGCKK